MDTAPGALFDTGTNIGSRAETVQVSNAQATLQWYTETIYSENRDKTMHKYPSKYVVPLSRTYKRVLEIELLAAEFPRSIYTIESRDPHLGNCGNNSFRFGEGYIIDNGDVYGLCNDRLRIHEYDVTCAPDCLPASCGIKEVYFPRTVSNIAQVSLVDARCKRVKIRTCEPHNLTLKYTPCVWVTGGSATEGVNTNGKYEVGRILDSHTFEGLGCTCDGPSFDVLKDCGGSAGQLFIPRVATPHILAEMVQDYLNERAEPPVANKYSVTFNPHTGRFVFDRGLGILHFDVLGSDERSIFPTMGFSTVDYLYGRWSSQNIQQVILPSDQFSTIIRPTIVSESNGESALVTIREGLYTPSTLAESLTQEMERPLVFPENDLLVAQLLGQRVEIIIPNGMYTPDSLSATIAMELTRVYSELGGDNELFWGRYNLAEGVYEFGSSNGAVFGFLFAQSTCASLLGFDRIDLTGHCFYTSMRPVYVPVANGRYTSGIYRVLSEADQFKFRYLKTGQFQAPIVKLTMINDCTVVHTWSRKEGGLAHGLQEGDLVRIEGPEGIVTSTGFVGVHVVKKVLSAFKYVISGTLKEYVDPQGDGSCKQKLTYVMSHWFEPFFLHFPGVEDTISKVIGFPESQSGCLDYLGPSQWDLFRRCELFLNIQFCDGEYRRIHKNTDSGPQSKYTYEAMSSFVRIPITPTSDVGVLPVSSFTRRKRFLFNSVDFSELAITVVDAAGNPIQFNGRDHCFDIRFLTEQ